MKPCAFCSSAPISPSSRQFCHHHHLLYKRVKRLLPRLCLHCAYVHGQKAPQPADVLAMARWITSRAK